MSLSDKFHHSFSPREELAHNINIDDNKLMINKIKDFLKNKLGKKRAPELDEDMAEEDSSVVDLGTKTEMTNPFKKLKSSTFSLATLFRRPKTMKLPSMKKDNGTGGGSNPILSPSLSKAIEKFFSRSSREPIHQAALVILICGVTWTVGKIAALALKGQPNVAAPKEYALDINTRQDFDPVILNQVRGINPFRTNAAGGGKKKLAQTKCTESERESDLNIELMNTTVLQDSVKSIASVQVNNARELLEVREGDKIQNMAEVFRISRLSILFRNLQTGTCESKSSKKGMARGASPISMMSPRAASEFKASKKMTGIENVGNKFQIKKTLLDDKMKDLQAILTQARGIPITNPDGTMAFKIVEIDPGGIFPYLGIQDGDVITSINGKPIYSLNEVMNLFGRIRNLDQLSLGIKREGTESVQDYSIQK